MSGLTLDTGALIALERRDRRVALLLQRAQAENQSIAVPATVIAQAVRDPARQVGLNLLMRAPSTLIADLDRPAAVAIGQLLAATGTNDITDGHVALAASRLDHVIVTSDRDDLAHLAPHLTIVDV